MADFSDFPNIEKYARTARDVEASFAARTILANYKSFGHDGGLRDIDTALQRLLGHGSLSEQTRDLFGRERRQWWKAYTELLSLAAFADRGILAATQWPSTFASDTAPFDGHLRTARGDEFVIDIKNGAGSGELLLEERLGPVVEEWRVRHSLPPVQIAVKHVGPLVQPLVGSEVRGLIAEARAQLDGARLLPQTITLTLKAPDGEARLQVTLTEKKGIKTGSGMGNVDEHATFLRGIILDHARQKADISVSEKPPPFFLVYIVPFGSANTDFRPWLTECAMRMIDQDSAIRDDSALSRWMGLIYLDLVKGDLRASMYLRQSAPLPTGVVREQLLKDLCLDELWPSHSV